MLLNQAINVTEERYTNGCIYLLVSHSVDCCITLLLLYLKKFKNYLNIEPVGVKCTELSILHIYNNYVTISYKYLHICWSKILQQFIIPKTTMSFLYRAYKPASCSTNSILLPFQGQLPI